MPPVRVHLSEATKQKFLWSVNRDNPSDKISDFFQVTKSMQREMIHIEALSEYRLIKFFLDQFTNMKSLLMLVCVVINFLLLLDIRTNSPTYPLQSMSVYYNAIVFETPIIKSVVFALMLVQLANTCFIYFTVCIINGPLVCTNQWEILQRENTLAAGEAEPASGSIKQLLTYGPEYDDPDLPAEVVYYVFTAWFLLSDPTVYIHLSYFVMALLAVVIDCPFISGFHLLDLIYGSETLNIVSKSVTFNGIQLLMTALLMIIVIYFYSVVGFLIVRNNYFNADFLDDRPCDAVLTCFFLHLREGILNGGGIADYLPKRGSTEPGDFAIRFLFDLSFYILITIVFLNVIAGIIIDTFAAMREDMTSRGHDMRNNCFMCSIDRSNFERKGISFERHIHEDHNMWQYLFYLVFILSKDPTSYTGVESYVAGCVEQEDSSFFPIYKALCLETKEEEDPMTAEMDSKFKAMQTEVANLKKTVMDLKAFSLEAQSLTTTFEKELVVNISKVEKELKETKAELAPI